MRNVLYVLAALSMAIGVGCGAFGAHGLRDVVPPNDLLIWEKAVFYQLVHGLGALVVLASPTTIIEERKALRITTLLLIGSVIFSGSLYTLVLMNLRWLGMITPLGGTCFIVAWGWLAITALQRRNR